MSDFIGILLPSLTELRKSLHRIPELSGVEKKSSEIIGQFLSPLKPDRILTDFGGNGIAFVFESRAPGPGVMIRCEMDALPIGEKSDAPYHSGVSGVSHACGHDGHMAIVAGLACLVSEQGLQKGRLVLLFQPAEETGEGALRVMQDPRFPEIKSDMIFALHNLPGYPLGSLILKPDVFHCASRGMAITLLGTEAHAAYPEQGRSPAQAMCRIIDGLVKLPETSPEKLHSGLVTVIHARLGEKAFGTAPGQAQVMATLREETDANMDLLAGEADKFVRMCAEEADLKCEIRWTDVFPACYNHREACDILENVAQKSDVPVICLEKPLRVSEDFGRFTQEIPGAIFGIGAGEAAPHLHQPNYDFPDALIPIAVLIFWNVIQEVLGKGR